jgi:two-component system response regulator NreC
MEVVAEAKDGHTTVKLVRKLSPRVVIVDISMPDLNGIEATRQMLKIVPRIKVICLSMHSDKRFLVEMLQAGALGYLLKDCAFEEPRNAIHSVVANETYLSPKIAHTVVSQYLRKASSVVFSSLTSREPAVLQLLTEGKSTKEIAFSLELSVKTVETHRQRIMDTLNIYSVAELTRNPLFFSTTTAVRPSEHERNCGPCVSDGLCSPWSECG